uniref:LIM and SH3 domain protein 1 n=1 Tax=Felis catus TaxID=9685 RepID=A0ABI8AEG4_FELCA
MNPNCARCGKIVYPTEKVNCLDKFWHKACFHCETCKMTLNMKNYKGYEKTPYCNACATRRSLRRTRAKASVWWQIHRNSRESRRPRTRSVTYAPLPAAVEPALTCCPPRSSPPCRSGRHERGQFAAVPLALLGVPGWQPLEQREEGVWGSQRPFFLCPRIPLFCPLPTEHVCLESTILLGIRGQDGPMCYITPHPL